MATQGILSITKEGKVVTKIVTGCDGYNIDKLVEALEGAGDSMTLKEVHNMALDCGVGCRDCLVVLSQGGEYHEIGETLSELYYSTFEQPKFNPRWVGGTAAYVRVVVLTTG